MARKSFTQWITLHMPEIARDQTGLKAEESYFNSGISCWYQECMYLSYHCCLPQV